MGPGIIIPLVIVAVVVPGALMWARRAFTAPRSRDDRSPPTHRLTGTALRDLPTPPWRVVFEIADDKLGGSEHVLIGPAGIFAVQTAISPIPEPSDASPEATEIARAAIVRGPLDDALRRCAMASDRLLEVHWAPPVDDGPVWVEVMPGVTAVDGRRLVEWAVAQPERLSPAQVELAWQTVTTSIGRPDPLS